MIKRTILVTGQDPQQVSTAINAAIVDTEDKGHIVLTIRFSTNCEKGVTDYNALLLIGDGQ